MGIPVKLQAFEGPLDLLLHLIEKNKVNIYDIPIVEITEQYMEYIRGIEKEELDVMSEFLVMAATLLDIKSRMLLPPEVTEEGEEIDPREELVQKLLEYKMYKYMSYELRDKQEDASFHMFKDPTIPEEVRSYREPVDIDRLLDGLTLQKLHATFRDILRRQEDRVDPIRSKFGNVKREEFDLSETMQFVGTYIMEHGTCMFGEILRLRRGKMYKIVTFLTLLQLMKDGMVEVEQPETFSDIRIRFTGEEGAIAELSDDYD